MSTAKAAGAVVLQTQLYSLDQRLQRDMPGSVVIEANI